MLSRHSNRRCGSAHRVVEIYSSASGIFESYPVFEPDGVIDLPDRVDVEAVPFRIGLRTGCADSPHAILNGRQSSNASRLSSTSPREPGGCGGNPRYIHQGRVHLSHA